MAFDAAGEIEFEQHQLDLAWLEAGEADNFVDLDRRRAKRLDHSAARGFGLLDFDRRNGFALA